MKVTDLGPLEQGLLRAVVHAELLGMALPAPMLWRSLPRYETSLDNVQRALAEGGALRGWLHEVGGLFSCLDREGLPQGMAAARRRAEARWERVGESLVDLAKLPYVEAVAIVGPMAWGALPVIERPTELVVLAEGRRDALARAGIAAWCRGRGEIGQLIEVVEVISVGEYARGISDVATALASVALRPVVGDTFWDEHRAAEPELAAWFPNWRADAAELPDFHLAPSVDGKLAAVLRLTGRRRSGPLGRLDGLLERRMARRDRGWRTVVLADLEERIDRRWQELCTWDVDEPQIPEPPRRSPDRATGPEGTPVAADARKTETPSSDDVPASRRTRGGRRRPPRARRSAASPQSGQSGRGRRRDQ